MNSTQNNEVMSCLYPKKHSSDYKQEIEKIRSAISKRDIDILDNYDDVPYDFNGSKSHYAPSIKDVSRLYVAIDFIKSGKSNDEFDRYASYFKFFNESNDAIKEFLKGITDKDNKGYFNNINIDVVKGSIYKIKKYFLENSKIKDIRGGSAILDYLNIEASLDYLRSNFIEECSIYCGGGNIYIIVPYGNGEKICMGLEKLYTDTALTAMNVFEYITCSLNDFGYKFNEISRKLNDKLEERKKIKIYPINPDSIVKGIKIRDKKIKLDYNKKIQEDFVVCSLCGVRDAIYIIHDVEGEIAVCPSCLRKHRAGSSKSIFFSEYERYVGMEMKNKDRIKTLEDVADNRGYIAVIYGDGNNMGNVVQKIRNPFEMMYFSRKTDEITKHSVYSSIADVMGPYAAFEVIALGGDDIFIVVPADKSLDISKRIIDSFDSAFDNEITMSVGICISKKKTPIKNLFEIAQDRLKSAKSLVRKEKLKHGTVDIVVLESSTNIEPSYEKKDKGLFPVDSQRLGEIIDVMRDMKREKGIGRSQIYKLRYASSNMIPEEFQLFYLYQENRNSSKFTKYISSMFHLSSNAFFNGFIVERNNSGKSRLYNPWNDITMLWDYTGGENNEKSSI